MQKIYALLFLMTLPLMTTAQQDPQFSHYFFNQLFINPAVAGSENLTRFQAIYRSQYVGYQSTYNDGSAPITQIVSANVPLKMINSGVGLYFMNDKIGTAFSHNIAVSYAYHIPLANGQLGVGIKAGLYSRGYNYDQLRPRDANDPLIATGSISQSAPDMGFGLYYNTADFTVGLALNHLNEPNFSIGTADAKNTLKRHAYLTASTLIGLSYTIDISPMLMLKTDLKSFSPEGGLIATYNNKFYFGGSYRLNDAITAMAGINLMNNALRIGYAFDYVIGGLNAKSNSSHEIMLSYAIAPFRAGKKSIIRTPRYRY